MHVQSLSTAVIPPILVGLFAMSMVVQPAPGQAIPSEQLVFLTEEWAGERFPDGRPRVSDELLERMKIVSIEEAWGVLRGAGYHNQFEGGWKMIHDDEPVIGRALTALYMPTRPEIQQRMTEKGHAEGRVGPMNSWPIDMLSPGDVYVADAYGKIEDGTLIGDNLGNAIYAKSGNGVIFDGSLRDLGGLEEIEGFNAFVRDWHPSFLREMMLMGVNTPIRIGEATVFPGDVVLARREGVLFIPAHFVEEVVETAEIVTLRDRFGHQRLREGTYSPGEIDTQWSEEIRNDFFGWLEENIDSLPVPRSRIEEILETRTW